MLKFFSMHVKGSSMAAASPGAQYPGQMFLTGSGFWSGRETGEPGEKPSSQVEIDWKLSPHTIADVGGANVEYNANLTSPGIQHKDTRIVVHLHINPAQQDLTLVIKWEPVFPLGQAALPLK